MRRQFTGAIACLLAVWAGGGRSALSDSETIASPGGSKKGNRYDGVGIRTVPLPQHTERQPKARAVWTTVGPHLHFETEGAYSGREYASYLLRASQIPPFPRWQRALEAAKRQIARHTRRFGRRIVRNYFRAGPQMSQEEFRRRMQEISKIGRSRPPRWRFQYDEIDPVLVRRYEREWDDVNLIAWGPVRVTDSGAVDLDIDLRDLPKLWKVDLEDVQLVPPPPEDKPPPLLGQRVRFNTNVTVRISTSRVLKPFVKSRPSEWLSHLLNAGRYLRCRAGFDLYTDILRRRYFSSEVEFRLYRNLSWAAFLNVVIEGK